MNITWSGRTYHVVDEWDLARFLLTWHNGATSDLMTCWKWRIA